MTSAAEQLAANLNFGAFAKAEDLKKRIWFTLAALLVYRLGTFIPLPGINPAAFAETFKNQSGGILGMFNMFAGGAVERMAIFALNIMPYRRKVSRGASRSTSTLVTSPCCWPPSRPTASPSVLKGRKARLALWSSTRACSSAFPPS
jgi:hypothetical protein